MIVRDAAPFIEETLASVAPHIDDWVIVDTGSTDATPDVVQAFFDRVGLPGSLVHRRWRGFAENRTEALELCTGRADYAWMVDADDLLNGEPAFDALELDGYSMRFGVEHVFWRLALFRLDRRWEFRGAVHEYAVCLDEGATTDRLGGPHHMTYRSLGTRSQDPHRFERDVELLIAEAERRPDDPRTAFYLAQSHRDAGNLAEALHWYNHRAGMPGWEEERFVALLEVARCLEKLGRGPDDVARAYLEAAASRPSRAEPLYELARHHRLAGRWREGYDAACRAESVAFPPEDMLFVQADVYWWRATDERAICAHYLGLHDEAIGRCDRLLASARLPLEERHRVLANRSHSLEARGERLPTHRLERVHAVLARVAERRSDPRLTCTITTCRRRELFERTIDSFLENCHDVLTIDRWICIDDGSSEADRRAMQDRYPFFEFIFKGHDERGHTRSMNRLLHEVQTPYWLHLEDDWQFASPGRYLEHAQRVLDDDPTLVQVVLNRNYAETFADHQLVGGELVRTDADGIAYRRHRYHPAGSTELNELLDANPGRLTNAHWPGFSLTPSLIATDRVRGVGAFSPGAPAFEFEFACRAERLGYRVAFLDTIPSFNIGRMRNERAGEGEANAYELNGLTQYADFGETKVGLVPSWTTGDQLAAQWRRQFPASGSWRGLRLVDPGEDPDVYVVVNGVPEGVEQPPPHRTIFSFMEPAAAEASFVQWGAADPVDYLQVRSRDAVPNTLEWHLDLTYDELWTTPIVKTEDLSTVVSSKRLSPGHHFRLDFLHHLERQGTAIDIYGHDNAERFLNHRGALPPMDKRAGLLPYRYTIAVENHCEPNYVTEKLVDAVLAECLCFYWGCPNLEEMIDPDAFIRLPLDDFERAATVIERAVAENAYERRIGAIRSAKRRLLDDLQLAPTLARVVHGRRIADRLDVVVVNLDRRPDRLESFMHRVTEVAGVAFAERCQRFAAVDGASLAMSDELAHMFRGSDTPLRRNQTACALSHLALWWQVATGDGRSALILEDDAEFVPSFTTRLTELCGRIDELGAGLDLVMLGLHHRQDASPPIAEHQQLRRLDLEDVIGGSFAYLITQRGARRLLELAEGGIPWAIDTFMLWRGNTAMEIFQAVPALVQTPVAHRDGPVVDSDIQYDHEVL